MPFGGVRGPRLILGDCFTFGLVPALVPRGDRAGGCEAASGQRFDLALVPLLVRSCATLCALVPPFALLCHLVRACAHLYPGDTS